MNFMMVQFRIKKYRILNLEIWNIRKGTLVSWEQCYGSFIIESNLKELKIDLNVPSFLDRTAQLAAAKVEKKKSNMKIHVERTIQSVKKFKVICNEMSSTLHR